MMRPNKKFYKRPTWLAVISILIVAALTIPTTLTLTAKAEPRPEPAAQLAGDAAAKRVAVLIEQLGSVNYKEREEAQKKLVRIGRAAVPALCKAATDSRSVSAGFCIQPREGIFVAITSPYVRRRTLEQPRRRRSSCIGGGGR